MGRRHAGRRQLRRHVVGGVQRRGVPEADRRRETVGAAGAVAGGPAGFGLALLLHHELVGAGNTRTHTMVGDLGRFRHTHTSRREATGKGFWGAVLLKGCPWAVWGLWESNPFG